MAVTGALSLQHRRSERLGGWSVTALVLAGLGVAASTWLVVSSDGDPTHVLWPLVVAPAAIGLVPVLVPREPARLGALLAMGGWILLTGLSIGLLLLPALAAQVVAVITEGR